ncbi:MAG: hypothetical protein KGL39_17430 [Patescibacteria group bacterium]|nr:hypothetical protein [Patescibacteria group bacterium]
MWEIAPRPFPEAHFATFPEALAEPCILAGCPEHVCPVCGAPWTRATHKERIGPTWNQRGDKQRTAEEVGHNLQTGHERYRKRYEVQVVTDGFRPTCDCPGNDGQVGGVVLDPFAGAGTVTLVAKRLGRSSIYVDLNPDYARIAERRCFEQREIQEDYTYEVIDARKEVTADA